jgi:hypothetical protein
MNCRFVSFTLSSLVLLGTQGLALSTQAALPSARPEKLEHMDYFRARKVIMGHGWNPVSGPCMQVSKDTCTRFPEIESCSGVGQGLCAMVFVKQNRCLYITTSGGEPERGQEGDTHVESVTFDRGPCSKN